MVQTWKQNSWPMYYQFKHRIISHISRAISKTPFNFCTDRKSQHPPLHQRPEKHRGSQKFHPLLRSSQNRVVTPWEKLTAYILLLNIKVQQVLWTQSSLSLCSLSEQKGWCWDFRGCVIVHQSKPACVTGVTQCFFLWLSRLWSQAHRLLWHQGNLPSPAQSRDSAMNTAQNEWKAAMQIWRGFVQCFSSPTSQSPGVTCFAINLHKTTVLWEFQPFQAAHKLCRTADGI